MVGVNMAFHDAICECFEGTMLEPCLLKPCFHVAGNYIILTVITIKYIIITTISRRRGSQKGDPAQTYANNYICIDMYVYIYIYIYDHMIIHIEPAAY